MGVRFDMETSQFVSDFEHDGADDIIQLTGKGYQVEAFGRCFYYGYEFSDEVDGNTTSESTLNEILRALRVLNPDNAITIFSLIGRKDLMAEAMPGM